VKKTRNRGVGGGVAIIKYREKVGMYDCNGKVEIFAIEIFFWIRKSTDYVLLQATISCG
jgi:hypothetical protein